MLLDILTDAAFTALIALALLVPLRSLFSWLGVRRRHGVGRLPPLSDEAMRHLLRDIVDSAREN